MSAYKPDLDHTKQVIFARNMPVPQSCAVAKSEESWWATGQSNLASASFCRPS